MMTKNKLSIASIVLLFLTLLLAGCSSVQVGQDFDVQLFNNLVKANTTTKSQVKGWLGAPNSIGISLDKDGEVSDEWMYFYGAGSLSNMKSAKIKILQIRFNKNGIINSYNWSNSK